MHLGPFTTHSSVSTRLLGLLAFTCAAATQAAVNEWTETGPDAGWAHRVVIHPTHSQIALLSTARGIYRTTDGTAHWTLVNEAATGSDLAFDPSNPNRVVHASEKLWMSADAGQTFALAQTPADVVREVEISATGTIYVTAMQGKVFKSTDHGNTWTACGAPWSSTAYFGVLSIDRNSYANAADHLFIAVLDFNSPTPTNATWRSVDGCSTWIRAGAGDPLGSGGGVSRYVVMPTDPNRVLAAGDNGIYRSTNGGDSWTQVHSASTGWIEFDPHVAGGVSAVSVFGQVPAREPLRHWNASSRPWPAAQRSRPPSA